MQHGPPPSPAGGEPDNGLSTATAGRRTQSRGSNTTNGASTSLRLTRALARALGVSVGTLLAEPSDASKTGQIRHILNELHAAELDLQKAKQRHTQIRSQLAELNPAQPQSTTTICAPPRFRALQHDG
jgi:hypothetical protein